MRAWRLHRRRSGSVSSSSLSVSSVCNPLSPSAATAAMAAAVAPACAGSRRSAKELVIALRTICSRDLPCSPAPPDRRGIAAASDVRAASRSRRRNSRDGARRHRRPRPAEFLARELPKTAPVQHHRGLQFLEEQFELVIVEVELANAREPLIRFRGGLKSGAETLAVAGEDSVGARAIGELHPNGVRSTEQFPRVLGKMENERWPFVDCFDTDRGPADEELKLGGRWEDAAVRNPKGVAGPLQRR